mmetsp:Transcript_43783/g.101205  ORF Transcript_43783/g.101205 Transcript_43783/m.101205 type:complete len:418 (+) Transcript_43783:37-1290(+)
MALRLALLAVTGVGGVLAGPVHGHLPRRTHERSLSEYVECSIHANCTSSQYCSEEYSCYPCISCTNNGDSYDGSCEQCADEEALNSQDAYDFVNCESHDSCADNMYCHKAVHGNYTVQDCWPCADLNGYTCEYYADAFDGDCSATCADAVPTTDGCTSHMDCAAGSYCSSYEDSAGTAMIVTCNPCIDAWDFTCEDYDDPVDGRCDVCAGSERQASDTGSSTGNGGSSSASNECQDPAASKAPVAFQTCSEHTDCRRSEYCSAYMGTSGCVIDCWPCTDMYSITCKEYGDAIDGSCSQCEAGAAAAPASCRIHNECAADSYCASKGSGKACAPCKSAGNVTCEDNGDSFNGNCKKCDAADSNADWKLFGVIVIAVAALIALGAMFVCVYKAWKSKYGSDDVLALRGNPNVREMDAQS